VGYTWVLTELITSVHHYHLYSVWSSDMWLIARYPDELAWQLDLDRMLIRQNDRLKRLHQFLVQETESVRVLIEYLYIVVCELWTASNVVTIKLLCFWVWETYFVGFSVPWKHFSPSFLCLCVEWMPSVWTQHLMRCIWLVIYGLSFDFYGACYSMSGTVSTWMGDHLWVGKPSWHVTSHLGRLSL